MIFLEDTKEYKNIINFMLREPEPPRATLAGDVDPEPEEYDGWHAQEDLDHLCYEADTEVELHRREGYAEGHRVGAMGSKANWAELRNLLYRAGVMQYNEAMGASESKLLDAITEHLR